MDNDYSRPFTGLGIRSNQYASGTITIEQWREALQKCQEAISSMPENVKQRARRVMEREIVFALSFDECLDLIMSANDFDGFGTDPQNRKKQVVWMLQDILRKV